MPEVVAMPPLYSRRTVGGVGHDNKTFYAARHRFSADDDTYWFHATPQEGDEILHMATTTRFSGSFHRFY